jgi:hypothetical protein
MFFFCVSLFSFHRPLASRLSALEESLLGKSGGSSAMLERLSALEVAMGV